MITFFLNLKDYLDDLDVQQINLLCWTGCGYHSETFLLLALFYQSTPSWLKVRGGVVVGCVAHVIIVSAQSKELGFWVLRLGLSQDLGPVGTGDWGLGA